jgi:hypothetical protein
MQGSNMNWLDRARREFRDARNCRTAVTADGTPTAVMAVSSESPVAAQHRGQLATTRAREEFDERAAMMEFDGGLSRDEAERAVYALVYGNGRPHS